MSYALCQDTDSVWERAGEINWVPGGLHGGFLAVLVASDELLRTR